MSTVTTITTPSHTATRNACKLCSPLGASLVFKGIAGAVPLLHGSQGCSTYIRRYLISHFKEPVDIACSNFAEQTAIFGGGANLKLAIQNIRTQYEPSLIGIATTCLSETIGDDVPMFLKEYRAMFPDETLPPLVHVSTPSYQGTHMQGFRAAVLATVREMARKDEAVPGKPSGKSLVNLFPGMVSPADLRHLREIAGAFGLWPMILPDYADTLDGPLWTEYHRIPEGGTTVADITASGNAAGSVDLGITTASNGETAGSWMEAKLGVPRHSMGLPIGIDATDRFMDALSAISGNPVPASIEAERGRLTDAYVDGHKYVSGVRAVVFGDADLVAALAGFLGEIGVVPVLCATGDGDSRTAEAISGLLPETMKSKVKVMTGTDFMDIEAEAEALKPDFMIGHSKGYTLCRRLGIPLVRVGFPIHDRFGGQRLLHLGYRGTQVLFDRVVNAMIERRQDEHDWGYTYM